MKYLILLIPIIAFAGERHHEPMVNTPVVTSMAVPAIPPVTAVPSLQGTALGLAASQHQFDQSTYRWQASVAAGTYRNRNAYSLAIGKRLCTACGLLNGSIGTENGATGGGIGYSWNFK